MAKTAEPIEAVIISGPRRGEIIHLPDTVQTEVSDDDIRMLNETLDTLIAVIEKVSTEVCATSEWLREHAEAS